LAKPKTTKVGLCKELKSNVFHYGGYNAATAVRVTQEKIQQYVGTKYGKDIANRICNKVTVELWPPQYSEAIVNRHQEWERLSRRKQTNLLATLEDQLQGLEADPNADHVKVATPSNDLEDLKFEMRQEVPHKLTSEEMMEYSNEMKAHSVRVATGETPWTGVFAHLRPMHSANPRQNEAREGLGTSECVLQATGSLQAHRECGVEAD
jgi:hypothetical protein